jgi:O-antigen/teichoic acid export membrane protein
MMEPGVLVRSVSWAIVESLTLVLLSFFTVVLNARLLGPADFGVAATVIAVIGLLNTAVEGLFSEALVQRPKIENGHVNAALWAVLGVAALLVVICWATAGLAASGYGEPRMAPLLRAASFGLLFSGYSGVQSAILRRNFAFRHLAMRTLVARLFGCGISLLLAFNGYGPWSLIAQYLSATILSAVALWYWSPRMVRAMPRRRPLGELWRFAGPWLANEILQVNLARLYQAVAAYLFGPYQFGLMGIGFRITDTMRDLIAYIGTSVGLPVFARIQHDPHQLAKQYCAATSILCMIALPSFVGLAICAPTIVQAVLGEAWLPSVPLIQMLALGASVGFTAHLGFTVFNAIGRPALALPLTLFDLALSMVLLFAVSGKGVVAASLAWSLRQVLSAIVLQALCLRVLPLRLRDIAQALARPILLVLFFAALLWPVDNILLAALAPVTRLVLLAPISALILMVGIALVRPDLVHFVAVQLTARKRTGAIPASVLER